MASHGIKDRVAIVGMGTVGTGVAKVLLGQADRMTRRAGRPLHLRRAIVRDLKKPRGVELPAGVHQSSTLFEEVAVPCWRLRRCREQRPVVAQQIGRNRRRSAIHDIHERPTVAATRVRGLQDGHVVLEADTAIRISVGQGEVHNRFVCRRSGIYGVFQA